MGGKGSGRKAKDRPPAETNYGKAWREYKKTSHYYRASLTLSLKGMKQPMIDNWIQSIFGEGFIASGTKIEII